MRTVKVLDGYVIGINGFGNEAWSRVLNENRVFVACVNTSKDGHMKVGCCQGFANNSDMMSFLLSYAGSASIFLAVTGNVQPSNIGKHYMAVSKYNSREISLSEMDDVSSMEDEIIDSYLQFIDHILQSHRLCIEE